MKFNDGLLYLTVIKFSFNKNYVGKTVQYPFLYRQKLFYKLKDPI